VLRVLQVIVLAADLGGFPRLWCCVRCMLAAFACACPPLLRVLQTTGMVTLTCGFCGH
jgi:hypothetical protein